MMRTLLRLSLKVLCAITLAATAHAFTAEARVTLLLNGTTNGLVDGLVDPHRQPLAPMSPRTTRDLLARCGRTLMQSPRLKSDPALRDGVAQACGGIAASVLDRSPSNGRALALALLASGRPDEGTYALAQAAAPFEPWALNVRLEAIRSDASPDAALLEMAEADFGRALLSDWGRTAVAGLYRDRPSLRPAITRAAGRVPAPDQAAFLGVLRRISGAG